MGIEIGSPGASGNQDLAKSCDEHWMRAERLRFARCRDSEAAAADCARISSSIREISKTARFLSDAAWRGQVTGVGLSSCAEPTRSRCLNLPL
jgi:hypothetical protein